MSDEPFITNGITTCLNRRLKAYYRPIQPTMDTLENHERYLILFIQQGEGILEFETGHNCSYSGPCLILINEKIQKSKWIQGLANEGFLFYFHPILVNSKFEFSQVNHPNNPDLSISDWRDMFLLEEFRNLPETHHRVYNLDTNVDQRMRTLGNNLESVLLRQEVELWPCFTRSYLVEMLLALQMLKNNPAARHEKPLTPSMKELEIYLRSNYNKPLTLDGIAAKFNTNRTSLSKKYRDTFGISIKQFLQRLRFETAASLLSKTGLSIQEIGHRVGYSNLSHFNRLFKEQYKLTPSEYRKKNRPW